MKYAITFGAAVAPLVSAHGFLTSPTPRSAGTAMESACGQQIYNNMAADAYGNIQGEQQLKGSDYTDSCNLWLCKGMQYADNTANVQSYSTGQVVAMTYDIRAPHTGTANVSVVDTSTNTVIGDSLASWSVFASNSGGDSANETSFSITIPDLAGKCTTAGECVIQHYWNSDSAGQTYESCVDFTVGGSSSSGSSSSSSSSSSVAASTAAATQAATTKAAAVSTSATSAAAVTTSKATVATSAAAAATSAAASSDDGDDDSCDADDDDDSCDADDGEDDDDDSCDSDETSSSAVPTTLVTRTSAAAVATSSSVAAAAATSGSASSSSSSSGTVALYGQCGGINYSGSTTCASGTCTVQNDYYSQCI